MSLAVQFFVGGLCRIEDVRDVKDDKSQKRVTLAYMGGNVEALLPSNVISAFQIGDMVVAQFEARQINFNQTYGQQTYLRSGFEIGRLTLLRKPTKDEF